MCRGKLGLQLSCPLRMGGRGGGQLLRGSVGTIQVAVRHDGASLRHVDGDDELDALAGWGGGRRVHPHQLRDARRALGGTAAARAALSLGRSKFRGQAAQLATLLLVVGETGREGAEARSKDGGSHGSRKILSTEDCGFFSSASKLVG